MNSSLPNAAGNERVVGRSFPALSFFLSQRSFGIRCPPCTRENPTYGIHGLFHVLQPALAWLRRLVAPRGHGNPSIVSEDGMKSEGVGSY